MPLLSVDRIRTMMAITAQSVTVDAVPYTISKTTLIVDKNDQLPLVPDQAWLFIKSDVSPIPGKLITEDSKTFLVIGTGTAPDDTTYKTFVYDLSSEVTYTPVTADSYDEFGKKIINAALDETLQARVDSGNIADDTEGVLLPIQSFIIHNPSVAPKTGCKITFATKQYDIDNVKEITASTGEIIAWRLTV